MRQAALQILREKSQGSAQMADTKYWRFTAATSKFYGLRINRSLSSYNMFSTNIFQISPFQGRFDVFLFAKSKHEHLTENLNL